MRTLADAIEKVKCCQKCDLAQDCCAHAHRIKVESVNAALDWIGEMVKEVQRNQEEPEGWEALNDILKRIKEERG